MTFEIVTCVNDGRVSDLRNLLRSIRHRLPDAPVRVIPFTGETREAQSVAAHYNARWEDADPFWDDLGKRIYAEELYRPSSPSWTYFRKLNMFNASDMPRLFLDANCLLLAADAGMGAIMDGRADVVFHSGATRGRNFDERFAAYVEAIAPEGFNAMGYNLGHCAFTPDAAHRVRLFAEAIGGNIRAVLGKAPEQAFLSFALLHSGLRSRLLCQIDEGAAITNSAKFAVERRSDGTFAYAKGPHRGKTLVTIKRAAAKQAPSTGYDKVLPMAVGEG